MRLALAIVLTTFVSGAVAHAGGGKQAARKAGVKFVVDHVNKQGQVVEREVVTGPIGRSRGKAKGKQKARARARQLTVDQQVKGMMSGVAVDEVDAAMPTDLTLKGRLEEVESFSSAHNGGEITRTRLQRKGAEHRGTAVETRVYARGKLRRIRPAEVLEEPLMRGKGESVTRIGSIEQQYDDQWGEMSGLRLHYQASHPTTIWLMAPTVVLLSRDLVSEAMRTGHAGTRDVRVDNDGEHVTITALGEGGGAYRMTTEHMAGFLKDTFRSVPRADEGRWTDLDAELGGL
jgi:hypothetical protein